MQKRNYYYAFAFILIIIGMIPWIEGMLFKRHYFHLIDLINKDNRVKIDVLEYHEGWLHSYAKIHITINKQLTNLYLITTPIEFTIEENISHGPIVYDSLQNKIEFGHAKIRNDIHLSSQLETLLVGSLKSEGVLQIEMLSEFDGDWSGQIHISKLILYLQNIGKVTWDGLNSDFKIIERNNFIKKTKFDGKIELLTMQGDTKNPYFTEMAIQPIKYSYIASHENAGLFSGNSHTYTPSISIIKPDGSHIMGSHLAMNTSFSMDKNTFYNINLSINSKNLKIPNEAIPVILQFQILISASNFSTHGLFEYLNNFKSDAQNAMQTADLKAMESLLVHTIMPTSIFHGNISLNTSLGAFTCSFKSSWRPDVPIPNTFSDVISSAYTEVDFIMSPAVVQKIVELYKDNLITFNTPHGKSALINNQSLAIKKLGETIFELQVKEFLKQGKINEQLALQIIAIKNQHQPAAAFSANIDRLSLTPEITSKLKQLYQLQQNEIDSKISIAKTNETDTNVHPLNPETTKQLIDDLELGGFLKRDVNNNYVAKLTIGSGVWKVNGVDINYK